MAKHLLGPRPPSSEHHGSTHRPNPGFPKAVCPHAAQFADCVRRWWRRRAWHSHPLHPAGRFTHHGRSPAHGEPFSGLDRRYGTGRSLRTVAEHLATPVPLRGAAHCRRRVKPCGLQGVPWTQAWASMYLISFFLLRTLGFDRQEESESGLTSGRQIDTIDCA